MALTPRVRPWTASPACPPPQPAPPRARTPVSPRRHTPARARERRVSHRRRRRHRGRPGGRVTRRAAHPSPDPRRRSRRTRAINFRRQPPQMANTDRPPVNRPRQERPQARKGGGRPRTCRGRQIFTPPSCSIIWRQCASQPTTLGTANSTGKKSSGNPAERGHSGAEQGAEAASGRGAARSVSTPGRITRVNGELTHGAVDEATVAFVVIQRTSSASRRPDSPPAENVFGERPT